MVESIGVQSATAWRARDSTRTKPRARYSAELGVESHDIGQEATAASKPNSTTAPPTTRRRRPKFGI